MALLVAFATAAACLSWALVQARAAKAVSLNEDAACASDASWTDVKELIESVLDVPYVWGGKTTDGWDCSGFVGYILENAYGLSVDMSDYNVEAGATEWSTYSIYHLMYDLGTYLGTFSDDDGYEDFAEAYAEGTIRAGDVIVFYTSAGEAIHTALVGDDASFSLDGSTYAGVSIYHALSVSYGTLEDSMARLWAASGSLGNKSYTSFKVFRGLSGAQEVEVTFTKSSADAQITVSNSSYYTLEGAVYEVYAEDRETLVATFTTDADGNNVEEVLLEADATYYVREASAPAGYEATSGWMLLTTGEEDASFALDAETPLTVTVTFSKTSASADLVSDEDALSGEGEYSFAGATYEIHRASDDALVATVVLGEDGTASYGPLACETAYYAMETAAPDGFVLSEEPVSFTTGTSDGTVSLADEAGWVALTVVKSDACGATQAGATLEGAVFQLVDANGEVHTAVTDGDGVAVFEDALPLGSYTLTEVSAPEGYEVSDEVVEGCVTAEEWASAVAATGLACIEVEVSFEEAPTAFDLAIEKTLTDTSYDASSSALMASCEGVAFTVTSNTTGEVVATLYTDDTGLIDTGDAYWVAWSVENGHLPEGTTVDTLWFGAGERAEGVSGALPYDAAGYTIEEVASTTPAGYKTAGAWTLSASEMRDGRTVNYIVSNDQLTTRLQIVKVDAQTGEAVALAGFEFQLLDEDGAVVTMTAYYPNEQALSSFTTDETGCVTLPETLGVGSYTLVELSAEAPYLLSSATVEVVVEDDQDLGTLTLVEFPDEEATGAAAIVKTDAESGARLAGAVYDVVAQEDVVGADGIVRHVAGEVVATVTTDEDGTAAVSGLSLGTGSATYAFVETAAPEGYVLDSTPVAFTVTYEDMYTEVISVSVTDADEQALGAATITKACADCSAPVAGAVYDVVAVGDVVGYDGVTYCADGEVVATVATDEDGTATVEGLRLSPDGATYAFVETYAPEGYVLDSTPIEFTVTYEDQCTSVVSSSATATDALAMGRATITKTCALDGELLSGAVYDVVAVEDIVSADGIVRYAAGEVVETVVTGEDGTATTSELHLGSYAFVETWAPEGHVLDATPLGFTLAYGDQCTAVVSASAEAADEATEVHVCKVAAGTGAALAGAEFTWWAADDEVSASVFALAADEDAEVAAEVAADDAEGATVLSVTFDETQGAWVCSNEEDLTGATVTVTAGGEEAGSFEFEGTTLYFSLDGDGSLVEELVLLKPGAVSSSGVTDEEGDLAIHHLAAGDYRIAETDAPAGYVADSTVHTFAIGTDGRAEAVSDSSDFSTDGHVLILTVEDDFTKVYVSKYDITGGTEVEGAELTIYDSEGNVYASWTSTTEPHYLEAMPEGDYTLVEVMTPRTYDEATAVEFTVEKTGEIQTVSMVDEPISIEGEIDKKQEIADPTASGTVADEGESNASVSVSEEGDYDYTLDYRSTSSTWTDEFTVTDSLTCATEGLAHLTGITTAVAEGDYDGLMNVWYQTNLTEEDCEDTSGANATLSDGHANSWLDSEATEERTGADDRVVDYTGWVLWAADISTAEATFLSVEDLGLAEGEYVTAIRFEYGRVEAGFTTREDGWDAELLKDGHDDIDDATPDGDGADEEGSLSPAIVHMQVTDAYVEDTVLENEAEVELFRNGGGDEDLEDADEDRVVQTACSLEGDGGSEIAQTGSNVVIAAALTLAAAAAAGLAALHLGRAPATGTDSPALSRRRMSGDARPGKDLEGRRNGR